MDPKSGLEISPLEFNAYRIVKLKLDTHGLFIIEEAELWRPSAWRVGVGFANISYYEDTGVYGVPLAATLEFTPEDEARKKEADQRKLIVEAMIIGLFKFSNPADSKTERGKKLIFERTGIVLLPYLRAAISSALAMAGYGAIPMPLINLTSLLENDERVIEIVGKQEEE